MLEFIKMFGMGIFYTIISPIVLVFFALFLIYSLFNYLVCEAINLSGFFFGKRFTAQTTLDKECNKIKKEKEVSLATTANSEEVVNEDGDFYA
jgi:hypothetical protein